MAEKKKWIRERGLIEIEGKEFPHMLFALINKKKHYYECQSYVQMSVLPKKMQDKIRQLLRIEAAQKAAIKAIKAGKRKDKVRS